VVPLLDGKLKGVARANWHLMGSCGCQEGSLWFGEDFLGEWCCAVD